MSFELWKENGWLREHKTSVQEVAAILGLAEREDLLRAAKEFKVEVETWLRENHPATLPLK